MILTHKPLDMSSDFSRRTRSFHPESLMMSHGYDPKLSEGSLKCPIFQTSTFVFNSAQQGKDFFALAYGKRAAEPGEELGLIYSRLNNPDVQILEERLALWDKAESCAVFESGMAAISTVFLAYLKPGDALLYSRPVYGGTDHFINKVLPEYGIEVIPFSASDSYDDLVVMTQGRPIRLVYAETPANPTNALIDLSMCAKLTQQLSTSDRPVHLAVDNTYMGPLWQHPLDHGADLVLYSATKYIGGHSDLIAGAVSGSMEAMQPVRTLRTFLGNMASPWTSWMLMRSLETLKVRMDQQALNAARVADYLKEHPKVERVYYLGHLTPSDASYEVYQKQLSSPGAMVSFDVVGGESGAFAFLDHLKLFHLAVSLGSTESLAEHPYTMTHADVDDQDKIALGISESLVRLSIGVEHPDDLIWDMEQALTFV